MSSVITGEAVVLELRPASFASRAVGTLLDMAASVALFLLGLFVIVLILAQLGSDQALTTAIILSWVVVCFVITPITVETLSRGKSLGRMAMGLRIVRADGGSIHFRQALVRGLIGFFELYLTLGSMAFLISLFNDRSQRLGDLAAGTYSLRERIKVQPKALTSTPPRLAHWAQLADIGRIPDGLARRVSKFLGQAAQMTEQSRNRLAGELATEVSAWVAPAPPSGAQPGEFLAAVVTERRNRDLDRLRLARDRAESLRHRSLRLPHQDAPGA